MKNMTTEDIKTMNDILQKYNITSWSLAWSEDGKPVLLPVELDMNVKSEILVKDAPPADMESPKFDLSENKWKDVSVNAQAEAISKLQDQVQQLKNSATDSADTTKKFDQINESITQLTQLFIQNTAAKAGATNE